MITELSRTDGEESADSAQNSRSFGEFVVNERSDWSQGIKPSLLNVIHML